MDANTLMALAVVSAYILDLWLGDPAGLPHPIIGFGKSISFMDKRLNKSTHLKLKGLFAVILLIGGTYAFFYLMNVWLNSLNIWLYACYNTVFLFFGLANRTLIKEVKAVFSTLSAQGLAAGRTQIARLVGRDTAQLNEHQIKKAALETLSENLSDGVVAPLFYFAIGGIPALMTYKMINTLDSMIGYKNDTYRDFGFFAAKLDDVANFIPARLTAFLMALSAMSSRSLKFIFTYGHRHSSPNAGYPEAALAGILDVRFGGPGTYHGQLVEKPYIGNNPRAFTGKDLQKSLFVNHAVCLICIILITLKVFYFGL
ncbi:MAG: cobalamin biosynthesis protein CobD [Flavobacteriia bacterium]|nr:MAG: cobalamin biosynthesis protein CobD [Flavobacteriia bacterium]